MYTITQAGPEDYARLLQIWEASVRATHHFLSEEDIQQYKKAIVDEYFAQLNLHFLSHGPHIAGFIGLESNYIQMLFIDPEYFGQGMGTRLMQFACNHYKVQYVDVNEQNPGALSFYRRMGFEVFSRSPLDPSGKPFPMVHMRKTQ